MENYTSEEQYGTTPKLKNVEAFLDQNVAANTDMKEELQDIHISSVYSDNENLVDLLENQHGLTLLETDINDILHAVKQDRTKPEAMTDLTKVFIDLSKCSQEQRKEIAIIVNQNGHSITSRANYEMSNGGYDELFPLLTYHEYWYCSRYASDKTELTYSEFIKLFEGGDNNGWTKIESEADLPKENGYYFTICRHDDNIRVEILAPNNQDAIGREWYLNYYTHYQPIQKPLPPKF